MFLMHFSDEFYGEVWCAFNAFYSRFCGLLSLQSTGDVQQEMWCVFKPIFMRFSGGNIVWT